MKKITQIFIVLIILVAPVFCFTANAETLTPDVLYSVGEGIYGEGRVSQMSLPEYVGAIIKAFLGVLGVALVGIIVYGGYLYMTAGGESAQVEKAKLWIVRGIVGMIIMLSAYAITDFVIERLVIGQNAIEATSGASAGATAGSSVGGNIE